MEHPPSFSTASRRQSSALFAFRLPPSSFSRCGAAVRPWTRRPQRRARVGGAYRRVNWRARRSGAATPHPPPYVAADIACRFSGVIGRAWPLPWLVAVATSEGGGGVGRPPRGGPSSADDGLVSTPSPAAPTVGEYRGSGDGWPAAAVRPTQRAVRMGVAEACGGVRRGGGVARLLCP